MALSPSEPKPAKPRRRRSVAALITASVALLAIAAVAVLAIRPDAVAQGIVERALPAVSSKLGRAVAVDRVRLRLFPPRVELDGLTVAGAPGEPPLVSAGEAIAFPQLWPLVRSRGHDVRVRAVELRDVTIVASRDARGRWNFEGLGGAASSAPPSAPAGAESSRSYLVRELRVRNGVLQLRDATTPGAEAIALRAIDIDATDLGTDAAAHLTLAAAFASKRQDVKLTLAVDPRTSPATLEGDLDVEGASLERLRPVLPQSLAQAIDAGTLAVRTHLRTVDGEWKLQGDLRTAGLALRGHAAEFRSQLAGVIDPSNPSAMVVRLDPMELEGDGLDVGGSLDAHPAGRQVRFALTGRELDLDAIVGATPPAPAPRRAEEPVLPPRVQQMLRTMRVQGTVALDEVRAGRLRATKLDAEAALEGGRLTLSRARAQLYGGQLVADGSTADLAANPPEWKLQARLDALQLASASQELSGTRALQGLVTGTLALAGRGLDWKAIRQELTGNGQVGITDGALAGADVAAAVSQPLAEALQLAGLASEAHALQRAGGSTALQDLSAGITIARGLVQMHDLAFATDAGQANLSGAVGLDGRLDFDGTLAAAPAFVAQIANGWQPPSPIPVPLRLQGTLTGPAVRVGTPQQIATALLESGGAASAARGLGGAVGDVRKRLGRRLPRMLP